MKDACFKINNICMFLFLIIIGMIKVPYSFSLKTFEIVPSSENCNSNFTMIYLISSNNLYIELRDPLMVVLTRPLEWRRWWGARLWVQCFRTGHLRVEGDRKQYPRRRAGPGVSVARLRRTAWWIGLRQRQPFSGDVEECSSLVGFRTWFHRSFLHKK